MFKKFIPLFIFLVFTPLYSTQAQEVTGLSGFSLFLDPGHSQTENMGLYNYSEAQKVLRVGLYLQEMLMTQTDIDTVYLSRTNDNQQVSLSQRTDLANILAPDFYHSIHSNAGSNTTNNTLFLYGGWRSNGQTVEKTPQGGKDMGDIMELIHTDAMRIPTIGNWADRNFYQGSTVTNHTNQWPYLHVNRETDMASVLSESGFHTNPEQQQLNLNADWKRLEAQSFFWSVLEYLQVERPAIGIASGIITDADTGLPINGATVTVGDSVYITDTYESLFNQYSAIPGDLRNGFYYIQDLDSGLTQVIVEADGFYSDTSEVQIITTDFSFKDVALVSSIPPIVSSTSIGADSLINPGEDLIIEFSRPMNTATVDSALKIMPSVTLSGSWNSAGTRFTIPTGVLDFNSRYTLSFDSIATDISIYAHALDGNADGIPGDPYFISFDTGSEDILPPVISDIYPTNTRFNELRPVITATFSEHLDTSLIDDSVIELRSGGTTVPGKVVYYPVGDRSVLNFFPSARLNVSTNYTMEFSGTISDTSGNSLGSDVIRTFPTGDQDFLNEISIDDFDGGLSAWWEPSQSGSTAGYIAEETGVTSTNEIVNLISGSTGAMHLSYGWDTTANENLIRQYRSVGLPGFASNRILQTYVFGDGSGNKFRFMIRDGNSQLEGSSWYTVDWIGWKLVSWDMAQDSVIGWVNGNGVINGNSYVDSYQLTYAEGAATSGFIIFDDLRAVEKGLATSIINEESDLPSKTELSQNYPNPFNPTTNISFGLPQRSQVTLKVYDLLGREVASVFNGVKTAGYHTLSYDASRLSSGVYLYQLITDQGILTKKMTLIK